MTVMKWLLVSVCFLFLMGCGNRLQMGYYSVLNKEYRFNINAPVLVIYDTNDLLSSYYADLLIYELQRRGFNSLYKQYELPLHSARNVIFMRLYKDVQAYPVSSYTYSVLNDGVVSSCYFYGDKFFCDNTTPKKFNLTDFSQKTAYSLTYHVTLDWYDSHSRQRVLFVDGVVFGNTCGYGYVFRDLIYHTVNRIDFNREEQYTYTSRIPNYWTCN